MLVVRGRGNLWIFTCQHVFILIIHGRWVRISSLELNLDRQMEQLLEMLLYFHVVCTLAIQSFEIPAQFRPDKLSNAGGRRVCHCLPPIGCCIHHAFWVIGCKFWFLQDPAIRPLIEQDSKTLQRLLPEIPQWVKNPDYDRVRYDSLQLSFAF